MATKTSNYEFNKPEQNDFYDVDVQNENWDKVDEELSEFDDSGVTEDIKSFPDFLSKFVTGNKVAITLRNLKAGLQFVLHAGQIVNNCVTDNTGLPLSAAQGKALKDLIDTTNNNLSNAGIPTVKKITDLYAIKKSGFYYYDAGATNAPMSSRGGMIVANYLSDSWISLTVVPYASSKIYTNTKYNNTWVGWAESATKDDLGIYFTAAGSKAAVYKQNVISVSIQLKAGYTYFLVGKNGVTISNDGLMSATFDVLSDAGSIFHFGNSRTTMSNGGGCVTAMIIKTVKDCTVNLIGYGYVNDTYNYEGRIIAIQLA